MNAVLQANVVEHGAEGKEIKEGRRGQSLVTKSVVFVAFRPDIRFEGFHTFHQVVVSRDGFVHVPDEAVEDEDLEDQHEDHHGQLGKEIERGREDLPGWQEPSKVESQRKAPCSAPSMEQVVATALNGAMPKIAAAAGTTGGSTRRQAIARQA